MDGIVKPGVLSTECWLTIASQVIGVCVLFGWVKPGDAHSLEDALKQIIVGTITVAGNAALIYKYIHGRVAVKVAAANASATAMKPAHDFKPIGERK